MQRKQGNGATSRGTALANIVRGAVVGGLHGAAVHAAASYVPKIIDAVVILMCLLLLMTFLVFVTLPNIVFGYFSATSPDIVDMTAKAAELERAYQEVDAITRAQISSIISAAATASTDSEGTALYDEVDIEEDIDNTNAFWLVAINSVRHHQNLNTMSAQSIKDLVVGKLVSNWSLLRFFDDLTDQETVVLRVDVKDIDPDSLMDALHFTEEERRWAYILYSTLIDDQFVDTSGYGDGLHLGDYAFTDAAVPVVYYSQLDFRWCNTMYGKSGTIGQAGCGPTALAIAVATFSDASVTPVDVARWSVQNGHRCEGNGSYHSLIPSGARHYGLTVESIGVDARKLVGALEDGKLVIALMSKGHFTRGGHFIVLRGITAEGEVLVADPSSFSRSEQAWALSVITGEANRNAGAGGPFWVVSP